MHWGKFILALLTAGLLSAQAEFEVASVRLSGPESRGAPLAGGPGTSSPERMTLSRASLLFLMSTAYEVGPDQIVGPSWLREQRYDIEAKLPAATTKHQANEMMQKLLVERFQLVLHHETRLLPVYELSLATGGPKLKTPANPDAKPMRPGMLTGNDPDGFPEFPDGFGGMAGAISNGVHRRTYASQSMEALVRQLTMDFAETTSSGFSPAHVIDKTGLQGLYDFRLEYPFADGFGTGISALGGGPELVQALEKQAGLRLEKTKAQFDVLIIDSMERTPTEN